LTPLIVSVPAKDRKDTRCKDGSTLRMVVNDLTNSREIEIACLNAQELGPAMTVRVFNTANGEVRCARTGADGRVRVPIAASTGDKLEVQIYPQPDAVTSYKSCDLLPTAPEPVRVVRTWEQGALAFRPIANPDITCNEPLGCVQYRSTLYPVGSPLVAPQTGLGLRRQTPDLYRLFSLTQTALGSGDPISYAKYYGLAPMPRPGDDNSMLPPRGFMVANTIGDHFVPNGTGNALARAAGALPFLEPSAAGRYPEYADFATPPELFQALGGKTPNDVLIAGYVIEGNYRLNRTPAGPTCAANYTKSMVCPLSETSDPQTCSGTLFDPDWHSEGADKLAAQHPTIPLRLARYASNIKDAATLSSVWQPRLSGAPFAQDNAWMPAGPTLALVNAYVHPLGQHVWIAPNPCKAFDDAAYYDHLLGRFLATNGADVYALSHPATHKCLALQSCDFLQ
jgi:hypothetical protein